MMILISFKIDTDTISSKKSYEIKIDNKKLTIDTYDKKGNFISSSKFNGLDTFNKNHKLP